jgi:hypothetical protein
MEKAVVAMETGPSVESGRLSGEEREEFRGGMIAVLDYLEGFWKGLNQAEAATDVIKRAS